MNQPHLSVVIPTHNRSSLLIKNLEALACQTWPTQEFEVIVVADACEDDTREKVTAYSLKAPYRLHLLCHDARSAAATRNLGASKAQGKILLFLDDDIIAHPDLLLRHIEAQHQDGIVLGYSKPIPPLQPSWWQYDAYRWWEDRFRQMRQPGHRFTYRDFFSGNVSMPASLFHQIGAFDDSITGRLEDYELGVRMIKAKIRFRFVPEAIGYHHDHTTLKIWARRYRQEGVADIQIGQLHPELRTSLFSFNEPRNRRLRWLHYLAFHQPEWGDRWEQLLFYQAILYEKLQVRSRWRRVISSIREYNYWRGVAMVMKERRALVTWLQEAPIYPAIADHAPMVDLAASPPPLILEEILKQATVMGLRLSVEGVEILVIPPQPGAEALQEEHLRQAIRGLVQKEFIPAVALGLIRSTLKEEFLC